MPRIAPRLTGFAVAFLGVAALTAPAQTREYTAGGRRFTLQVDQDAIWIPAPEVTTPDQLKARAKEVAASAITAQAQITKEDPGFYSTLFQESAATVTLPRVKGTLVPRFQKLGGGQLLAVGEGFPRGAKEVYKVAPPGGKPMRVVPLGSVVVQFKEAPNAEFLRGLQELFQLGEAEQKPYLKNTYSFTLKAPRGDVLADPFTVQNRLQQRYPQDVAFAEPGFALEVRLSGSPDVLFGKQWHLGDAPAGMNIKKAWDKAGLKGSRDVSIAVIDTGIDTAHEDLNAQNFVSPLDALQSPGTLEAGDVRPKGAEAHGTMTVGVIAAVPDNGKGVAGIAPDCRIIPIRAYDQSGLGTAAGTTSDAIARALAHAKKSGAKIINLSAEFPETFLAGEVLSDLTKADDLLIVAAAGNDGNSVLFPALSPHCMAVGAVGRNNQRLAISNFTPQNYVVSVMAPSAPGLLPDGAKGEIVTTDVTGNGGINAGGTGPSGDSQGNYYFWFNGTSAAAAEVSGVAALIWSIHPAFKASDVRQILQMTAKQTDPTVHVVDGRNDEYGYGKIDPVKAVEEALRRKQAMAGPGPHAGPAPTPAGPSPAVARDTPDDTAQLDPGPLQTALAQVQSPPTQRTAAAAAATRGSAAPAVHKSTSESEIASLDRKTVSFPTAAGGVEKAYVDPNWATVIGSPDAQAFVDEIAPLVEPGSAKALNLWLVKSGPIVRQDEKGVYAIPRKFLRGSDELRAQARKGVDLPTIQPVVDFRGSRLYPIGTLTVETGEQQATELKKVAEGLGLRAAKVGSGNGRVTFKLELTDKAKFENIFDAASELTKMKDLVRSVTLDSAAQVKGALAKGRPVEDGRRSNAAGREPKRGPVVQRGRVRQPARGKREDPPAGQPALRRLVRHLRWRTSSRGPAHRN